MNRRATPQNPERLPDVQGVAAPNPSKSEHVAGCCRRCSPQSKPEPPAAPCRSETKPAGRDAIAAAVLAAGSTREAAAKASGLSARTISRRLAEPGFQAVVADLRAQALDRASGILADSATLAARTLRDLLEPTAQDTVRLAAARGILDAILRIRECVEFERRLSALEGRLWGSKA